MTDDRHNEEITELETLLVSLKTSPAAHTLFPVQQFLLRCQESDPELYRAALGLVLRRLEDAGLFPDTQATLRLELSEGPDGPTAKQQGRWRRLSGATRRCNQEGLEATFPELHSAVRAMKDALDESGLLLGGRFLVGALMKEASLFGRCLDVLVPYSVLETDRVPLELLLKLASQRGAADLASTVRQRLK